MDNIVKKDIDVWVKPWDKQTQENIFDRDDRFFAIVTKGILAFLNKNVILNGKNVNHFVLHTGSTYLYLEQNNYSFSLCETTGENYMYNKRPRGVVVLNDINIPFEELTNGYVRGTYERISSLTNEIKSYNAEIKRMPMEISFNLTYVLSTFSESIILIQELIDKLVFQKYFNIVYLGQKIMCSIEFPQNFKVEFNKPDLASNEPNQKTVVLDLKLVTNYPCINVQTEVCADRSISSFMMNINAEQKNAETDIENKNID